MKSCIVIFGREPVPGRVKTRLARDIGNERAASIYRRLLERTLTEALSTGVPTLLSLSEPLTGRWTPPGGVGTEMQCDGDLGSRMRETFRRRFEEGIDRAVLIGSDCPGITRNRLIAALETLDAAPVVLGPATDGGYWAVGQRAPGIDCFSGVPWSSPETLRITRDRLKGLGVQWAEVETLADVDTVNDLHLLDDLETSAGRPA